MKRTYLALLLLVLIAGTGLMLISCGGAATRADSADTTEKKNPGNNSNNTSRNTDDGIPGPDKNSSAATNTGAAKPDINEILKNIDKYLVSNAVFPAPPAGGGISNGTVTVKNTLNDITFQKAILEVSILMSDGAEFRTDYYVLQNIEPGDVETVKLPNAARGTSVVSHIVKLKSDELTNGEMILVGSHYTGR